MLIFVWIKEWLLFLWPIRPRPRRCHFPSENRWRHGNRPILTEMADIGDGVQQEFLAGFIHLGGRLFEAKMQQVALPPQPGSRGRLVIDTAAEVLNVGIAGKVG